MKKRTSKEILAETMLELSRRIPIDKITVTRLVEESGLSSKTFYNHFQNKSDLMIYIEESEASRLHKKLGNNKYSFEDYLRDGLIYYRKIQHFIQNAVEHTTGHEDYGRLRAESAYQDIVTFLLKLNDLEQMDEDLTFALRLYVFGLVEMFLKADANDLLMYRTVPSFYRSLPGELPNKLLEMSKAGATEEEIYVAQHAYDGMRDGMLFGDLTKGYASFGLGISMIHKIEPVSVIMDRLMRGIEG